jgi:ribosomal-protein-alanine N-acetyltransferase
MALNSFETTRMIASRPHEDDFSELRRIHTDAETMMTLSVNGSILTEKESRGIFDRHLRHWDAHQFGIWMFSTKSNHESIGYCGLRTYELDDRPEIELFFGVRSCYFRMGYGFEMASAVVAAGFKKLSLPSVIAFTLVENSASRALMTKLGMRYEGIVEHAGIRHVLYRLTGGSE